MTYTKQRKSAKTLKSQLLTVEEINARKNMNGKLIVVEGIDGSGKSTQVRLLEKWFRSREVPVFLTEWNSSDTVKQITSKGKKKGTLTPITFSLLHATDFADRYERNILPLLHAGYEDQRIAIFTRRMPEILLEVVILNGSRKYTNLP